MLIGKDKIKIMKLPFGIILKVLLLAPLSIPHFLILLFIPPSRRQTIFNDLERLAEVDKIFESKYKLVNLLIALIIYKEFRNVFYMRLGHYAFILSVFLRPIQCMLGDSINIGAGFMLIHGYGTVINGACKIGRNCTVLQNVTIGTNNKGCPIIGDYVYIGAGAILIGNIKVGNNVKIGAGAVVVDNVPDNCTVVGSKAKVIMK